MKKLLIIGAVAIAMQSLVACSNDDAVEQANQKSPIPMANFAGRWVFVFDADKARVIDLSSEGTYTYEIRGGNGNGTVMESATGEYEVDLAGNISSKNETNKSPHWTATRKGDVMMFTFPGSSPVTFKKVELAAPGAPVDNTPKGKLVSQSKP